MDSKSEAVESGSVVASVDSLDFSVVLGLVGSTAAQPPRLLSVTCPQTESLLQFPVVGAEGDHIEENEMGEENMVLFTKLSMVDHDGGLTVESAGGR